jgi:hypothetical protein
MLSNKEKYKLFCEEHPEIPLFMQYWWMEAASVGKEWDVLLYEENNRISASFVYLMVTKLNFKFILQPELTRSSGIWIDYPSNISQYQKLSIERKIMPYFIEQIENLKFVYFEQNFHTSVTNWLPFYWKKYRQSTRYTYQIQDLSDLNRCFENFTYAKRKQINKAKHALHTAFDMTGNDFYNHLETNLKKKKNENVYYSRSVFLSLYEASLNCNQGQIIAIADNENNIHAALFLVWDNKVAYNLISSIDSKFKSSGASTLLVWEALKIIANQVDIFDFDGSMNKTIEYSFIQFGTQQVPYFNIIKSKSFLFDIAVRLKKMNS